MFPIKKFTSDTLGVDEDFTYKMSRLGIFISVISPIGLFWTGFRWDWFIYFLIVHRFLLWGHSMCLHTYFSHGGFKAKRWFQLFMATVGTMAHLGSVFAYSGIHKIHHSNADKDGDAHSPVHGFWHAFILWRYKENLTSPKGVKPFRVKRAYNYVDPRYKDYPEIIWLSRYGFLIQNITFPLAYLLGMLLEYFYPTHITALAFFIYIKCLPALVVQLGLLTINVLGHGTWFGYTTFDSDDLSRNSFMGFLMWGSTCFHNNHHMFPKSARTGLTFWETCFDFDYLGLKILEKCGVVWGIIEPNPEKVVKGRENHEISQNKKHYLDLDSCA
jgi:stearoyl-CoA desaturase (delta-9 desaturase)